MNRINALKLIAVSMMAIGLLILTIDKIMVYRESIETDSLFGYQQGSSIVLAKPELKTIYEEPAYSKGVNDALQALILLDLELKLGNERKTWGEISDIVKKRLGVEKYVLYIDNQGTRAEDVFKPLHERED